MCLHDYIIVKNGGEFCSMLLHTNFMRNLLIFTDIFCRGETVGDLFHCNRSHGHACGLEAAQIMQKHVSKVPTQLKNSLDLVRQTTARGHLRALPLVDVFGGWNMAEVGVEFRC